MLNRLPRDGCSEMAGDQGFRVSRLQSFKAQRGGDETVGRRNRKTTLAYKFPRLLADAELADHGFVALGIVFLEVVEQATTLADQHEKSAA